MITGSKEVGSPTKQEDNNTNETKISKASSSSSATWLRLKDPRIVRVSRALGGKDRHSKVCTIRGLRDRRVRLSVPTAIQLYDLQDRLGLNQPSKVVDWLLDAAKHEIDELPPLPMPPGNFSFNHQPILSNSDEVGASQSPNFWNSDAFFRAKSKELEKDSMEKENWTKRINETDKQEISSSSFLHNAMPPYGSFFQLEPPSFQLSHHMGNHGFATQTGDLHNLNFMPLSSTLSLSSGSQTLVCPPAGTTQSYFPASHATASMDIDPRQVNHFQVTQNLLPHSFIPNPYSIRPSTRPAHFGATPRLLHSQNSHSPPDKDQEFPCK